MSDLALDLPCNVVGHIRQVLESTTISHNKAETSELYECKVKH